MHCCSACVITLSINIRAYTHAEQLEILRLKQGKKVRAFQPCSRAQTDLFEWLLPRFNRPNEFSWPGYTSTVGPVCGSLNLTALNQTTALPFKVFIDAMHSQLEERIPARWVPRIGRDSRVLGCPMNYPALYACCISTISANFLIGHLSIGLCSVHAGGDNACGS